MPHSASLALKLEKGKKMHIDAFKYCIHGAVAPSNSESYCFSQIADAYCIAVDIGFYTPL